MKKYNEEFRQNAIKLARTKGVSKAAKATGVSQAGIRLWMKANTKPPVVAHALVRPASEVVVSQLRAENLRLKLIIADVFISQRSL